MRDILAHTDKAKYGLIHFVCGALSLDSSKSNNSSNDQDFASTLRSRLEVFRYLVELRKKNGLNDHIREAVNGRSPLHCFTMWLKNRNHKDAIEFANELLSLGARPDSIDRELIPARLTPLHYSLIYDNAELATHFVKNVEKIEWNKIKDAMPSAFLIACGQTSTSIDLLRCLSDHDDHHGYIWSSTRRMLAGCYYICFPTEEDTQQLLPPPTTTTS